MTQKIYNCIFLLLTFFSLILMSCQDNIILEDDLFNDFDEEQNLTDVEKIALQRSLDFLSKIGGESISSRSNPTIRRVKSVKHLGNNTRGDGVSDILLFNFKDGTGFTIISADTISEGSIYMASVEGNLYEEDLCNGSVFNILYDIIERYHSTQNKHVKTRDPYGDIIEHTTQTSYYTIGPYVDKVWHQNYPFNISIPNGAPVGCLPLAVASVMAYHKHPESYNGNNFNWDLINTLKTVDDVNFIGGNINEVSNLLKIVGETMNVTYDKSGSYATMNNAAAALRKMDYTCNLYNKWDVDEVLYNLSSYRPCIIAAKFQSTSNSFDHAFIVDGLYVVNYARWYTWPDGSMVESTILEQFAQYDTYTFLSCKFGWNGECDKGNYMRTWDTSSDNKELYPSRAYVYSEPFKMIYRDNQTYTTSNFSMITRIMKVK